MLLTCRPLFKVVESLDDVIDDNLLLFQMISYCGESFKVRRCSRTSDFFRLDRTLPFYSL